MFRHSPVTLVLYLLFLFQNPVEFRQSPKQRWNRPNFGEIDYALPSHLGVIYIIICVDFLTARRNVEDVKEKNCKFYFRILIYQNRLLTFFKTHQAGTFMIL